MPRFVTIVGLGPGDPALRTIAAQQALDSARRIILRTSVHPGLDDLRDDPRVTTCDDLYESGESFETVYGAIVDRVVDAASTCDLVYAVPGHPRFGEATVEAVLERMAERDIPNSVIESVSAVDGISTLVGLDVLRSEVQIVDALGLAAAVEADPFGGGRLDLSPARPCLVLQIYSPAIASAVKLALVRLFPEDHEVAVVTGAGTQGAESIVRRPLYELDHLTVDHLTSVYIPALPSLEAFRSISTLQRIVAQLRAPGGCPWDREQTHETLRSAIVEEAYEVVDAIDSGDAEALAEELGDLLLQPFMHAQIAEELGAFLFEDIVKHITTKLIRRHPHVFGEVSAATPAAVIQTWEEVKAEERRQKGLTADDGRSNPFDSLPRSMPATTRIASLVSGKRQRQPVPDKASRQQLAENLFAAVEAAARAGLDPEKELERMASRHVDSTCAGPTETVTKP